MVRGLLLVRTDDGLERGLGLRELALLGGLGLREVRGHAGFSPCGGFRVRGVMPSVDRFHVSGACDLFALLFPQGGFEEAGEIMAPVVVRVFEVGLVEYLLLLFLVFRFIRLQFVYA